MATIDTQKQMLVVGDGSKPKRSRRLGFINRLKPLNASSSPNELKPLPVEQGALVKESQQGIGMITKKKRSRTSAKNVGDVVDMDGIVSWGDEPVKGARKRRIPYKEEEVCFVCKDGGSLVFCNLTTCPKAYHPDCKHHDDKKKYPSCGWHFCSFCDKVAQLLCYTCTFSVCRVCIKEAEFAPVRGNKGFCEACMKLIVPIEMDGQGNTELGQISFHDKNSLEYLFKVYWKDLQGRISLTSDELTQAINTLEVSSASVGNEESTGVLNYANGDQPSNSDRSCESIEVKNSKMMNLPRDSLTKNDCTSSENRTANGDRTSFPDKTKWASKELLEFVAHVNDGITSFLCQFDVQALFLEYISRQQLRRSCDKSVILCDSRLEKLFGKAQVRHFEMLKLLESHFTKANQTEKACSDSSLDQESDVCRSDSSDEPKNQVDISCLDTGASNVDSAVGYGSFPECPLEDLGDMEKTWHHRDESGEIIGPFSMAQLDHWCTKCHFRADLRIWRTTEKEAESILLMDALNGKFYKESPE